jgi:hypothetical protein
VSAVVTKEDESFCFRLENGEAVRTPVQVGLRGDKLVEVLKKQTISASSASGGAWEDFTGAEEIVLGDIGALKDGQPVRVSSGKK